LFPVSCGEDFIIAKIILHNIFHSLILLLCLFLKVQRRKPLNPAAAKLWYSILKSVGLARGKEVAKLLDETTSNPKEAEMTRFQLLKVIVRLFLEGHTVQLGELGSLRLSARVEGSETEAAMNVNKIKSVHIHFIASA
jgi:hypothetical protein